jgi:hypothetical protein
VPCDPRCPAHTARCALGLVRALPTPPGGERARHSTHTALEALEVATELVRFGIIRTPRPAIEA